jgi:hypothetical protein
VDKKEHLMLILGVMLTERKEGGEGDPYIKYYWYSNLF